MKIGTHHASAAVEVIVMRRLLVRFLMLVLVLIAAPSSKVIAQSGGLRFPSAAVTDAAGNVYLTGTVSEGGIVPTPGVIGERYGGGPIDAFVAKLDPSGRILFATYLGGASFDRGQAIAIGPDGSVYVTGVTESTDFPTTPGTYDRTLASADAFVARLAPDASSFIFSTLIGGSFGDVGTGLAVRPNGSMYVTGITHSVDFPTTPGAPDSDENTSGDAFVVKLSATGSRLKRSTLFGNLVTDEPIGIVVDKTGVTIAGSTSNRNDEAPPDRWSTFVVKFNKSLTRVVFSKVFNGGGVEQLWGLASDASGALYITGYTASVDFPTTQGAYDTNPDAMGDAFIVKLSPDGSRVDYATLLGGVSFDAGMALAIDTRGSAVVVGTTWSVDFPVSTDANDAALNGRSDAFIAFIAPDGASVEYATLSGGGGEESARGVALDPAGRVWVVGSTTSTDYPTLFDVPRAESDIFAIVVQR